MEITKTVLVNVNRLYDISLFEIKKDDSCITKTLKFTGDLASKGVWLVALLITVFVTPFFVVLDLIFCGCSAPLQGRVSILEFYRDGKPTTQGYLLEKIWKWPTKNLENAHDYIQWIFPTDKVSKRNTAAPLTNAETIQAFKNSPELRAKMVASLMTMANFYGLQNENGQFVPSNDFKARTGAWVAKGDHNHLRITRILTSLRLHGLEGYAKSFFEALQKIYRTPLGQKGISSKTFNIWKNAALS